MKLLSLLALFSILLSDIAFANVLYPKKLATPDIGLHDKMPYNFALTNNLTHKKNTPYKKATGKEIVITGVLRDIYDKVIPNAKIQIWQKDGKNCYANSKNCKPDPNFMASGTIFTNNLGEYKFITIMPNSTKNNHVSNIPYINFKVSHKNFINFSTKMFFPGYANNNDVDFIKFEPKLAVKLVAINLEELNQENVSTYKHDMVLEGKVKYKY